ncbi:MAG: MBL fold metallo-hydrolase [Chlamydiales bacterium]|nr:MBL fold metallo-hydrolase [Chlamydiales bacterium]
MIGFCPLASGSKGNALYLGTPSVKILIDAGLSCKALEQRLEMIQVSMDQIDAILITHEHIDHIRGLEILSSKYDIPIFANADTAKVLISSFKKKARFKIFSTGETFEFADLEIHPFSIQHDAIDPVAFTIGAQGLKLGICADIGFITTHVLSKLQLCDYLYIEANHEISMVHSSSRPAVYKQRVLGRQGHLSNQECAQLIADVFHPGLKHIYLAHLSSECNSAELALQIISRQIASYGATTQVSIALQESISIPISFSLSYTQTT